MTWAMPTAALSPAVLADAANSPRLRSAEVMARLSPSSAPSSATRMEMRWFATYDFSLTGSGTECRKQRLKAAGGLAGLVHLATTPFFSARLFAPALDGFLHAHPGLRVELMEDHRNLDISRREADVAVRLLRPEAPGLISRRIGEVAFACHSHTAKKTAPASGIRRNSASVPPGTGAFSQPACCYPH
ncbi:LysR substrate-binding domain-containing protein [Ralstonia pseudosolanacearum]|nr:LysR substrate-binding domain-containing protein [Ralstonia pseudosolanacearum]MDO3525003.1 LysR substrate-binding domain-containing protein [Ralstonia pseudosolanacearum]MDO3549497.1 LysR substrate-binding domain-containing protein [Ralstonia pseudosolanacearum]MDO3599053.1 LysR substrate-binding domain-containing protein [Ralstonia pseudosolanacearum]